MEGIEKATLAAQEKLQKLKGNEKLIAELEWCLGSYRHDQNPEGLLKKGKEALKALKAQKKKSDRSVSKKLIEDLEKALK